jgi:hypothetical protein
MTWCEFAGSSTSGIENADRLLSSLMEMSDLPDDVEILKQIVVEQRARLLCNKLQIEQLKLELSKLRRMQFGRSSEQLDEKIAQLELTLEELEAREAALQPAVSAALPERVKPVRRPLPVALPRETVVHSSELVCSECGAEMRVLGEDVPEMLEYVPSHFEPEAYLSYVLGCIADYPINKIEELLPWNVVVRRPALRLAA